MEYIKLYDSELKLMKFVWENSPVSAKDLTLIAEDKIGWNKNTTYTVLKKLVSKGFVKRDEPNFICTPLITKEQVQKTETNKLINKLFNGSKKAFFSSFVDNEKLSDDEVEELKRIIEKSGD
ncbi:BlaI/MecI/CopY family transcriptional regulator [Herbivorax sp. ANBcel31]|uniref:BlaI/MecI/CopY family transcriptional regulator n=1 Tax=Herbivorax sp. ANBcel31 TaxID=3069754 RepID=UPI0027B75DE3|nr:BlaI/MecI/CopY family transcriptional regulator [Herbivorax sp. ANBcel31]MDQ2088088.1 BlaI/MecI/CopY family transcriptional regulator [Herbivorax sp. ANBcel31]